MVFPAAGDDGAGQWFGYCDVLPCPSFEPSYSDDLLAAVPWHQLIVVMIYLTVETVVVDGES